MAGRERGGEPRSARRPRRADEARRWRRLGVRDSSCGSPTTSRGSRTGSGRCWTSSRPHSCSLPHPTTCTRVTRRRRGQPRVRVRGDGRPAGVVAVGAVGRPAIADDLRALRRRRARRGAARARRVRGRARAQRLRASAREHARSRTRCWEASASSASVPHARPPLPYAELLTECRLVDGHWRPGSPRLLDPSAPASDLSR